MPSSVIPQEAAWPPPSANVLLVSSPRSTRLASGVTRARSNGLRTAPETTSGSSSTILLLTDVEALAFSVCSRAVEAVTSIDSLMAPTSSTEFTRTVVEAATATPDCSQALKPASSTRTL